MEETFKVDSDQKAEWALERIKETEEERDRLVSLAKSKISELEAQIKELGEKCENNTAFLKSCLCEYFMTVPHKETKTQETYQLLSAKLVMKKPSLTIQHNDEALIKALDGTEYVETKKSLKWGEYKKNLVILDDGSVVDGSTGELVAGCTVEENPGSFEIKF